MPAARWRRVVARLVDAAIAVGAGGLSAVLGGPLLAVILVVASVVDIVPVARWGTTPGKRLMGIRVVGPDGLPPGWARAGLRHALVSPFLLGALVDGAGVLRPRGTGAHDKVALTAVVRGPRQPLLPVPRPLPRPPAAGGDVAVAVWAGVWLSSVVAVVAHAMGSDLDAGALFTLLLPAQTLGSFVTVVATSRVKGTGSWRADFGWEIRLRHTPYALLGPVLLVGIVIVLAPVLYALGLEPDQQVTEEIGHTVSFPEAAAAVLTVGVVGPIEEELLFRGVLLRSLLRRYSSRKAMVLDGIIFALVHLLDPGVWPALPGLAFLGWFLARLTARSGSLSRAVFVHCGYNLTVVSLTLLA